MTHSVELAKETGNPVLSVVERGRRKEVWVDDIRILACTEEKRMSKAKRFFRYVLLGVPFVLALGAIGCEFEPYEPPEPPVLEFEYLAYSDYYSGNCVALKFDITNRAEFTVSRFRPEIDVTYDSGSVQTVYPDVFESIGAQSTARSVWVPVGCGMVWYGGSYDIGEVLYWDTDGNEHSFNYPAGY